MHLRRKNAEKYGYAPILHMNLDTTKIKMLGWNSKKGLVEMYNDMIVSMKNDIESLAK